MIFLRGLFAGAFIATSITNGLTADWPRWRGPLGNGHVPANEPVPEKLPASPTTIWRLKIGEGLASPVVAGGKVYYLDNTDGKETLHAIDATTAKPIWSTAVDDPFTDAQGPTGPRCTPVVDGDRVYAQSCRGELQCLNASDGRRIWHVNYVNDLNAVFIGEKGSAPGASRHGNNGSPLVDGPFLYACAGGTNGASAVCFDKLSGRIIWKSQNDQAGYAPPVIASIAGIRQIVCFTAEGVIGLAVEDGKLLWRVPVRTAFARHVTTPMVHDDIVVVASHQVGLLGTRIVRTPNGLSAEPAWLNKDAAMNFSSPVAVGGHLYGLGPARNLICVEIATGKIAWSKDGCFTTSADKSHAGFVVMRDNILTLTDDGVVILFSGDPQLFHEIGRAQVCGRNWCNPAYIDGRLFVRDGTRASGELICVDLMR